MRSLLLPYAIQCGRLSFFQCSVEFKLDSRLAHVPTLVVLLSKTRRGHKNELVFKKKVVRRRLKITLILSRYRMFNRMCLMFTVFNLKLQ